MIWRRVNWSEGQFEDLYESKETRDPGSLKADSLSSHQRDARPCRGRS